MFHERYKTKSIENEKWNFKITKHYMESQLKNWTPVTFISPNNASGIGEMGKRIGAEITLYHLLQRYSINNVFERSSGCHPKRTKGVGEETAYRK